MAKNKKQRRGAGRVATAAAAARAAVEVLEARTHFTASVSGQIYKEVDVGGVLTRVGLANWTVYSRPFYYDGVNPAVPGPTSPVQTASDGTYHINTDTAGYTYWVYILGAGPSGPYTISGGGYSFSDYNGDGLNDAQYDYGGEGSTVYTDQDFRIAYPTTSPNTTPDRNNKLGDCDCPPVAAQDPVRYSDGQVFEGATDLSADGYGMPWAQARSWSNTPGYARLQTNGNGWVTDDTPTLVVGPDGSLGMVYSGAEAQWFDQVGGGTYAARHDALDTLAFGFADDGSGAQEVTYTSRADGTQIRFYNPFDTSLPALKRGAFKSQQAPGAPRLAVYSSDSAGRPTELRRSVTAGGVTTVESWKHDYLTSGSNAGKLQKVTLRRSTNGGTTWATVRQVAYTYYGGTAGASDAFGNLGDLRTAEVQDAAGAVIDTWYYRYYKSGDANGYAGGMRAVFEPGQYARLAAALPSGTTPLTASNAAAAPYASRAYQYDSQQRVTQEVVAGVGSTQGTGDGRGTVTYAYSTSANADGYNAWKTKTVETRPDGETNTVYTNYLGRPMLWVKADHSAGQSFSGKRLATFYQYDAAGRLVMTAHPSAFKPDTGGNLWDEAYADLLHDQGGGDYAYLGDDFGQLDLTAYAAATTATATAAGDVTGLPTATYTRRGDRAGSAYGGDPIQQSATQYYLQAYTPTGTGGVAMTVTPVAAESVYPDAVEGTPGTARTTDYAYTYFASSVKVESVTVQQPVVSTGRNGPGGSTRDTDAMYFDAYGHPTWTKDAGGYLGYTATDPVTGAATTAIADVDSAQTTTFAGKPTGWATPAGGGLHLTTLVRVDALGRPTKVTDPNGNTSYTVYKDAAHEVRAYRGWNPTTHTATGPTEIVREYRPAANAASGQRAVYTETLTTSATAAYNATTNEPTGTEAPSAANIQSLSRAVTNSSGQVTDALAYYSLAGVTYAAATALLGTAGNDSASGNYHRTQSKYDAAGRNSVLVSPTGTISRTVFDGFGNAAAVYVGTNDAGATDLDPDGSGGTNNLVKVSEAEYDQSCGCPNSSGDGRATKVTTYPGGGAAARVTQNYYDWRGRLVATKSGVQTTEADDNAHPIAYADLNNLGQITASYAYDGDGVAVTETAGVPVKPSASLLRAETVTSYDEQLRPYRTQTYSVDPSSGSVSSNALTTNVFYDRRGLLVETAAPGGLVSKATIDGAGRVTAAYSTDGGGDAGWADADDVAGDAVLEQAEYAYDADGNAVLTTARQRFHDATATGALGDPGSTTAPKARVYYSAGYYDAADRPTASVDVGTDGGTAYTRPGSAPARSDTALVTSYAYDAAGRVQDVTDPRGLVTRTAYDLLDRTTSATENYVDGTPSAADDRITRYTYDGVDHVLTMTADLPSGQHDQTTQYVYGVTTAGGSTIASNGLLKEVRYPDKTTGAAGTASTDKEQYTYDAAGAAKTFTDRNGTVHTYGYDVLGRTLTDAVTTLATGVDGAVRRLQTAYDTQGNAALLTSYDAATGGNVVNQVARAFNGLGQLTTEYQAHAGAVSPPATPTVQYAYTEMASGANHSRLTGMTYPDGRVLRYEYNSGLDSNISRVSTLADDSPGSVGTHLADYSYLGLGTIVREGRPENGTELTYVKRSGESDGDAGDPYTGLDRFGRVVDQRWLATSSGTATDRFRYGYDRDGNPLYKANDVLPGLSELYHANGAGNGYDGLNRLAEFRRGALTDGNADGTPDTVATGDLSALSGASRTWGLDALGNQSSTSTDGTTTTRTHDDRNELTGIGSATLAFDANGNTTTDQRGQTLTYDAWNRLASVTTGSSTAAYKYDVLGRRVREAAGAAVTDLYYTAGWQVAQETTSGGATTQYVWGLGYVDDLVARDRDADANAATGGYGQAGSGREERLYAQRDANHNVTALTDVSGAVVQRFVYDPYGRSTILTAVGAATSGGYDWAYQFQGGRLNSITGHYSFRIRDYDPSIERWIQSDPSVYIDGLNTYALESASPTKYLDPNGLSTVDAECWNLIQQFENTVESEKVLRKNAQDDLKLEGNLLNLARSEVNRANSLNALRSELQNLREWLQTALDIKNGTNSASRFAAGGGGALLMTNIIYRGNSLGRKLITASKVVSGVGIAVMIGDIVVDKIYEPKKVIVKSAQMEGALATLGDEAIRNAENLTDRAEEARDRAKRGLKAADDMAELATRLAWKIATYCEEKAKREK